MTTREAVALYYEAWQQKRGDFRDVALADDFEFTGPVASFDTAEGYRAIATPSGSGGDELHRSPTVRRREHRLLIVDWEAVAARASTRR